MTIKSLTKDCTILRDVMGTMGEICVLVKYSPKREKMLGSIVENIKGEFEESSRSDNRKLGKLCVTRWTIRAKCFKKILDKYEALLELWKQSLKDNLDFDTKSRNGVCKNQMKLFKFYTTNACIQSRTTPQKLYNRKRCLPLVERSLLILLCNHWKT